MKNIETIECLDKSRIQFSEYQKFEEQELCLAKRICELQSDLSREKSKNEKLIEELEELQRENEQLKEKIEKMKCCHSCESHKLNDLKNCQTCDENYSKWEFAE